MTAVASCAAGVAGALPRQITLNRTSARSARRSGPLHKDAVPVCLRGGVSNAVQGRRRRVREGARGRRLRSDRTGELSVREASAAVDAGRRCRGGGPSASAAHFSKKDARSRRPGAVVVETAHPLGASSRHLREGTWGRTTRATARVREWHGSRPEARDFAVPHPQFRPSGSGWRSTWGRGFTPRRLYLTHAVPLAHVRVHRPHVGLASSGRGTGRERPPALRPPGSRAASRSARVPSFEDTRRCIHSGPPKSPGGPRQITRDGQRSGAER